MVATAKGVSQRLAEYALTLKYDEIPSEVIERTKHLFLDFLGVGFGGHRVAESTRPIIEGVKDLAQGARGTCSVLAEPDLYPPHYAALLNGTLVHSMDFDDTHRESIMHPGAPLFATLMALAEETGASGRDFLTAVVAGYDVGCKIGKAHGNAVHHRGFHPTATTGIFACTAAGARLLGLSPQELNNALGLNISQAAGSQQFMANGAWNKRFHVGLTAHNAIYSLIMARHGYLGATEPIEGRFGYFALYCSEPRDAGAALEGLGSEFEVMNTAVKPYPCCRYNHAPIDAVMALVQADKLSPSDIARLEIEMSPTGYNLVASPPEQKKQPTNIVEGQFSVYFAAAIAAAHRKYDWDSYNYLDAPDIRDLMQRITARTADDLPGMEARVTIVARDGRRLMNEVLLPKGEPEVPLSWEEMQAKFNALAQGALGPEKTRTVAQRVARLEEIASFGELTGNLRG